MLFAVSAATTGAAVFGVTGLLGEVRLLATGAAALAAGAYLGAAAWYVTARRVVPFGRAAVQTSRAVAFRGRIGVAYFGALLGAGLLTEMSTPLVWCGALAAAAMGVPWALAFGAAFGVGRSLPPLVFAVRREPETPANVVEFMISRLPRALHLPGLVTAVVGSGLALQLLL